MVLFGLKKDRPTNPCEDAVIAALEMIDSLSKVNTYLENHLDHQFQIGIGISFGPVVVGELGFQERRQFTAIGDVVNMAARLEVAAKDNSVPILVSDGVKQALPAGTFEFGKTHDLQLRGKRMKQRAHEVLLAKN